MEFVIVAPLAFLAGFVDAVAGGGGLISLPAYLFAGLPVHQAIATNKLMSSMGTTVTVIRYAINGYMLKSLCALGVLGGLAGSSIGSSLALITDAAAFRIIMLLLLPFVAFYVLKTKDLNKFSVSPRAPFTTGALVTVIALVIGMYDGFYGPGTGTFLMLLLTGVARVHLNVGAGTTKAINLATNYASLAVFLSHGTVLIALGLVAGLFNIAGNWLGSGHFTKNGSAITRPIMLVVIFLFAIKLILDTFISPGS